MAERDVPPQCDACQALAAVEWIDTTTYERDGWLQVERKGDAIHRACAQHAPADILNCPAVP